MALVALVGHSSAHANLVTYTGSGTDSGLNATADFTFVGSTLTIKLTNTSVSPFGGVDADASMVLSSINFQLPAGITITGGSVALNTGSNIVSNTAGTWTNAVGVFDLNAEYGYSNTGIGNPTPPFPSALNAVTSHSNGGMNVTNFNGVAGGVGGGLDFGLVASGSTGFGNNEFILDSVVVTL